MKEILDRIQIVSRILPLLLLGFISSVTGQVADTVKKASDNSGKLINIAYGEENKSAIGSAISTITSDELERNTVTNIGNALFGRLPGLMVNQNGGEPGNDFPTFSIRANSSYAGGNNPLIIIDGFQRNIDLLVVEEIESISVLKDAAATAMYGIKGANGVILITTKKGFQGKEKIEVNLKYGMQAPTRLPNFINSYDYAQLFNEARINDGLQPLYNDDDLRKYKDGSDPYLHPDVNWFNELLRENSPVTEAGISFRGGSNFVRHFVLVDYMVNQGLLKNTDWNDRYSTESSFKRLNFRSNIDANVTKRLVASLLMNGSYMDYNSPATAISTIFNNIYTYAPNLFPVINPNGTLGGNSAYQGNMLGQVTSSGYNGKNDRNFQSSFRLEHDLDFITNGLKAGAVAGFDNWFRVQEVYSRSFPVYQVTAGTSNDYIYTKFGQVTSLSRAVTHYHNIRTNFEAYLDYFRKFGLSEITGKLLYHQDKYIINWTIGNNTPYLLSGLSGRLAYAYNNKYFAEFVAGYNGTERFPKSNQFGFFPAISASWVVSGEEFLKSKQWINYLKLRASYGLVGNDDIGAGGDRYLYIRYYTNSGAYPYGDSNTNLTATQESNYPNYNITWEKSYKTDLGIEGRIFNNIDFELGYFHEKRTDIVDTRTNELPSILGITAGYVNNGVVMRQGVEWDVRYQGNTGDFTFTIGVNGIYTDSRIDKRFEPAYPNDFQYRVGHPVNQYFGLEAIGFLTQQDISNPSTPVYTFTQVKPGDVKYKDQDGNGFIDANDEIAIGRSSNPTFYYGINFGIKYKSVSLEGILQGAGGLDLLINGLSGPMGNKAQISEYVMKRWTPTTAATAEFPRLTTVANANNYRTSSLWLRSGEYLKLRSIELGYDLPKSLLGSLSMSGCRLFIQGKNLLTFDKIKNLDPENFTGYPALKSYFAGLRIQF